MTCTADTTIGQIVAADYRAAAVFEHHGIDFCCRGGRTLGQGCEDAGVKAEEVLRAIEALPASAGQTPRFAEWDSQRLIDHIVGIHHEYVRTALPRLSAHVHKIARAHGPRHPELPRVAQLVDGIAAEMTSHMLKEEQVLFPYIARLAAAATANKAIPPAPFGSVADPIHMMEAEHESVGNAMLEVRKLTDGYHPPEGVCRTYSVCLQELQAFERDLHAHVHLENHILFPRAAEMARRIPAI